jgi:dihydroorotate dehydrogenase electron transfer subunit
VRRARAEILSTRRSGAYQVLTLVAPEIAERARPGQFVAIRMPEDRDFLLRRHVFVHQASRRGGWAGTLELVVEPSGPGSRWLASNRAHRFLDVLGPLGTPFAYPRRLTNCLLVAEGLGAAPLSFLGQELVARDKRVDMVIGAPTMEAVFKPIEAKRLSQTVSIVTADGSLGQRGSIAEALADAIVTVGAQVVYAAAPKATLDRIGSVCLEHRLPAQVAVLEPIACGTGLCHGCVVPVARADGSGYDHLRACVEGPVFNPARILWDRWRSDAPRMLPTPPEGLPVVRAWPG